MLMLLNSECVILNATQLQVRDMQRLMRAHELRGLEPETKRERDVQLWEAWAQKYWYRLLKNSKTMT